jgi:uncharacterized protein
LISYFETSALVKLLVRSEDGSDLAARAWDAADQIAVNRLAYPESRAAFAAANRDGRLSDMALMEANALLDELFTQIHIVEVDADLANLAGNLAELFALRGYDSVHLASALLFERTQAEFVCWDIALRIAAQRYGLKLVPETL